MSAEQAAGLACGGLFLAAFFGFLLVLTLSGKPVKQPVKDPVDEQADGYQRAQYFTEEVMAAGLSIVAGQDLENSLLIGELQQAYARYRAGEDVYAGAPKESV